MKVLTISIDGAVFRILDPLVEKGLMPNLKAFFERSAQCPLLSTVPSITPAAWTTFATGKDVASHGIYHFLQFDANQHAFRFANTGLLPFKTLWEILSEQGARPVILNLPMTYPPRPVNGVVVSGFDTPSVNAAFTHPLQVRDRILKRIPGYDFILTNARDFRTPEAFDRFVRKARESLKQRFDLARMMLEQEKAWDFFMIHFQFIDQIQHAAWRYLDKDMAGTVDPERTQALEACFSDLDKYIGEILAMTDGQATGRIIMSDHGFGPMSLNVHLNNLLLEWGYLRYKAIPVKSTGEKISARLARYTRRLVRPKAHNETRQHVITQFRNQSADRLPIDWTETIASVPIGNFAGLIFFNRSHPLLQMPEGSTRRRKIAEDIRTRLLGLVHPESGQNLFRRVEIADPDAADYTDTTPDMVALPQDGIFVSDAIHLNDVFTRPPAGNHWQEGIFAVEHPDVDPGRTQDIVHMRDVMPIILGMMGAKAPQDLDGEIPEFLPFAGAVSGDSHKLDKPGKMLTDEESSQVEERLRNLGYL